MGSKKDEARNVLEERIFAWEREERGIPGLHAYQKVEEAIDAFAAACAEEAESRRCAHCGAPATCFGHYEASDNPTQYACDECCGHGNEDGECRPVGDELEQIDRRRRLIDAAEQRGYERGRAEADERLGRVQQWTHEFGRALCPRGADTYGNGMRDAKEQVSAILRSRPQPKREEPAPVQNIQPDLPVGGEQGTLQQLPGGKDK